MNKRRLTIVLGIVFLIAAGFGSQALISKKKPTPRTETVIVPKQVKVSRATNGTSPAEIEITGRLTAAQKIDIFSEVGGTLLPDSRRFREGNYFKKGDLLVSIDREEARYGLMAQKSSLMNQVTLILPELKTDYPASFPAWEAWIAAFDPAKPLAKMPEAQTEKEKYLISARNLYNLYFTILSAEERQKKYIISAPFNGVVAAADIKEGTLVRVGQKLGEFFNPNDYELEAALSLEDLAYVSTGQSVILGSDDIAGTWRGSVIRISDRIDPTTQTARIYVRVQGQNLKEGMYLSGKIQGKALDRVVALPRGLLIDQSKVYTVQDSIMKLIQVNPVRYSSQQVWVRGIPDGATMVNEAVIGAFEGMKVNPYESR